MTTLALILDLTSKALALLLLLVGIVFLAWQCFEWLAKVTKVGREFVHFIVNRRSFERWEEQAKEAEKQRGQLWELQLAVEAGDELAEAALAVAGDGHDSLRESAELYQRARKVQAKR